MSDDFGSDFGDFEEADDVWIGDERAEDAGTAENGGTASVPGVGASRAAETRSPTTESAADDGNGGACAKVSVDVNKFNTTTVSPEQYEQMVRDELGRGPRREGRPSASNISSFAELEGRYPEFLAARK